LIRQHDTGQRLEGFLKVIQASQTDALFRILDDNLARYLGQLLAENVSGLTDAATQSHTVVQNFEPRFKQERTRRPARALKIPPAGGNRAS